jgi:hypothetical protein
MWPKAKRAELSIPAFQLPKIEKPHVLGSLGLLRRQPNGEWLTHPLH